MKLLQILINTQRKVKRKALLDYKQELLVRQGREQFKKLIDRGISIPVAYL